MFKRKSDKLAHIKGVGLFAGLSKKQLDEVAKHCEEVSLPASSVLVQQDSHGRECFILVSGEVTIRRNNRKIASKSAGDIVGEMALLDDEPRTATAIAATDLEVLVLTRRDFKVMLKEVPGFAEKILTSLSLQLRATNKKWVG